MEQTSRKYHRRADPERVRFQVAGGGSFSKSNPTIVSPYGRQPYNVAGNFGGNFQNPLDVGTGLGGGRGYGQLMSRIDSGQDQGPLASYISNENSFLPGVFKTAQGVGQTAASQAPGIFNNIMGQIGDYLKDLPGLKSVAGDITSGAQSLLGEAKGAFNTATNAVTQAFSPIQQNALFGNALQNTLTSSREAGGARGLVDSGNQQAQEETQTRQLAGDFAQQQFQNQQAALQGQQNALAGQQNAVTGAGQALQGQAAISQSGIPAAQQGSPALNDYLQQLSSQYGIPLDALNATFANLAGNQNPSLALLNLINPTVGQKSSSWSINQSAGI